VREEYGSPSVLLVAGGFPPAEANGIRSGCEGNPGRRGICETEDVTESKEPSAEYPGADTDTPTAHAVDMFGSDLPDSFFYGIFDQVLRCDPQPQREGVGFDTLPVV
jgi:hypothetical protein